MTSLRVLTRRIWRPVLALGFAVLVALPAHAQHPIDVQRLTVEGDHFRALSMYELLPDRRMAADTHIAAAKSAWALGLTQEARQIFDSILRGHSVSADERARITLSRGIIEFQEERYQEAALFAEKAAGALEEKAPLRGRAFLLWGQSLLRLGAYATAEEKLLRALSESLPGDRPEINFSLGTTLVKLGKLSDAEKAFKGIPTDHYRAAEAVRTLAAISLQTDQPERARFWIEKGRESYPESFLDSWADYGMAQVALRTGDMDRARGVVEQAQKKYPASDSWLILMQGALEQAEWDRNTQGTR